MATWVRNQLVANTPSGLNASVAGTVELDNATAPGDFDPDAVNSVRIETTLAVISGTLDDDAWTITHEHHLTLDGDGTSVAAVNSTNETLNAGNQTRSSDATDSSIATGFSVAQWEAMEVNEGPSTSVWGLYSQIMMADGVTVAVTLCRVTIDYEPGAVNATIDQATFRIRDDDGSESAATWRQLEDINDTLDTDINFRIRFTLDDTTDGERLNFQPQLEYNLASGGWNDVNGASSVIRATASSEFTDDDDTTRQLSIPSGGSFITPNSGMDDNDGLAGQDNDIDFVETVHDFVEVEFCFQIRSADVSDAQTVQLRIKNADSFGVTPTITINIPGFVVEQVGWRWFEDGTGSLTAIGSEAVKPTLPGDQNYKIVRLRVELEETGGGADTNKIVKAQMSGDDGVTWEDMFLDNAADDDKHVMVTDGADVAGNTLTSRLLTNTDTSGKYHETQVLVETIGANESLEIDFALKLRAVMPDTDYRFRIFWDGTAVPIKSGAVKIELRGSTVATRQDLGGVLNTVSLLEEPASGDPNTLQGGRGERGFYDGTNWWVFYVADEDENSNVQYRASTDLAANGFGSEQNVAFTSVSNPEDFNVGFKDIGGTLYVICVVQTSPTNRFFKRGTISGTTITWDSTERSVTTVNDSQNGPPGLAIDDGGFVWFGGKGDASAQEIWAMQSVNALSNATYYTFNTVKTASQIDIEGVGYDTPELIGLASGEALIVYTDPDASNSRWTLWGRKVTQSGGMGSNVQINSGTWTDDFDWSVTRGGGNVYIMYADDETTSYDWLLEVYNEAGDSWAAGTAPAVTHGGSASDGLLGHWGDDDRLYVFDTDSDHNNRDTRIQYKSYSGGTSGTWDVSLTYLSPTRIGNGDQMAIVSNGAKAVLLIERGDDGFIGTKYAVEFSVLDTPAAGQTVAVGVLGETDAPVAAVAVKPIVTAVGVLAETDVPVVTPPIKIATIGVLTEVEALITAVPEKFAPIGVLSETDTLIAANPVKPIIAAVGVLAETEALVAVAALKVANIGVLVETDTLIPAVPVKPIITAIGVLSEIESLIAVAAEKLVQIGVLSEADALIALAPLKVVNVGVLSEADALVAVQALKVAAIGVLAELETLIPIQPVKPIITPVGVMPETDTLITVPPVKVASIGTLAEADSLVPVEVVQAGQVIGVTVLAETDSLIVVQPIKVGSIGTLNETEALITVQPVKPIITSVGTFAEVETLNAIQALKVAPIGTIAELDSLLAVTGLKAVDIGTLAEIESLIAVQALKVAVIGVLAEIDTLVPVPPVKPIITAVGIMIETDALISVQAVHVANVGTLAELEALLPVGGLKTVSVGTLPEIDALIPIALIKTQVVSVATLAELETLLAVTGLKTADIGTLAEIESLIAVQALKVVVIGTLAETDGLVPVAPVKPIVTTVGTLAELETLIVITGLKIADIGTLAEIESLIAVGALKVANIGTLAETDVLIPVPSIQTQVVPVATLAELDALLAVAGLKTVDVGTLAEIELLLAIGALKVANIGTIAEAESLIGIAAIKPIITAVGVLAEIESLLPISALKIALIGIIAELEALIGISGVKTADIGTIAESDILIPVTVGVAQTIAVSTLAGLDALIAVGGIKVANIGTLAEIETLLAVSPFKTVDVGTLAETEALIAVAGLKLATVGTLAEVESLLAIQGLKIADIGTLAELEALIAVASGRAFGVGTLLETDMPLPIQPLKVAQIGTLAEVETLLPILAVKPIIAAVGTLAELDALIAANPLKGVQIGTLAEADSLISIDALKIAPVGTMAEVNSLLSIAGFKTVDIGTMAELETLLSIQAVKGVPVGTVLETNGLIPIQALKPIIQSVGTLGETDILVGIVGFLGEPIIFVMNVESVGKRTSVTATEYDATQDATVEGT